MSVAVTKNPEFESWFAGSKVVDPNGNPLLCYHGSTQKIVGGFRPLTHFGTTEAAAARTTDHDWDDTPLEVRPGSHLTPAYLRIANPFHYTDGPEDAAEWYIFRSMLDQGIVTQQEYDEAQEQGADGGYTHAWIIDRLTQHGYDGLSYSNQYEDKGSTSWVIFAPDQVWTLTPGLPSWYQDGSLLTGADLYRLDASEFIEGDEHDYEWRLCRVPVALLDPAASWDEAVAGFIEMAHGKPDAIAEEHERIDGIKQWFEQHGIEKCLEERPLVVLLTSDGSLKILDGFHRRAVAFHLYLATHVLAAVGLGDPTE